MSQSTPSNTHNSRMPGAKKDLKSAHLSKRSSAGHADPSWRGEVAAHFAELNLSSDFKDDLTQRLLKAQSVSVQSVSVQSTRPIAQDPVKFTAPKSEAADLSRLHVFFKTLHNTGVGYAIAAVMAAGLTAVGFVETSTQSDPLSEITNLPGPRALPADFDLEGDPDAFSQLMGEIFPKSDVFASALPKEMLRGFKPSEGRFFTWNGQPGVSIQLLESNATNNGTTLLYVVKLGEEVVKSFPKEKTSTKLTSKSGKQKRVNFWRDDNYGYAMVQTASLGD
jgi:hypothetical protein